MTLFDPALLLLGLPSEHLAKMLLQLPVQRLRRRLGMKDIDPAPEN
jgi:hypothetical protein